MIEWGSNVGVAHIACLEFDLTYRQIEWDKLLIQAALLDFMFMGLFRAYDQDNLYLEWAYSM